MFKKKEISFLLAYKIMMCPRTDDILDLMASGTLPRVTRLVSIRVEAYIAGLCS